MSLLEILFRVELSAIVISIMGTLSAMALDRMDWVGKGAVAIAASATCFAITGTWTATL